MDVLLTNTGTVDVITTGLVTANVVSDAETDVEAVKLLLEVAMADVEPKVSIVDEAVGVVTELGK